MELSSTYWRKFSKDWDAPLFQLDGLICNSRLQEWYSGSNFLDLLPIPFSRFGNTIFRS